MPHILWLSLTMVTFPWHQFKHPIIIIIQSRMTVNVSEGRGVGLSYDGNKTVSNEGSDLSELSTGTANERSFASYTYLLKIIEFHNVFGGFVVSLYVLRYSQETCTKHHQITHTHIICLYCCGYYAIYRKI